MIPITKSPAPPELQIRLRELKSTPDADAKYENLDKATLQAIRESLLKEQGFICAYCMRRIDLNSITIEHYIAQHGEDPRAEKLSVEYKNMLGVCAGNSVGAQSSGGKGSLTCDKSRGNASFKILNPLHAESLTELRYRGDGIMVSDNPDVLSDIKLLNLNCLEAQLPQNRQAALNTLNRSLEKSFEGKGEEAKANHCRKLRESLASLEKKPEYVGVLLFELDKQIRKHSGKTH